MYYLVNNPMGDTCIRKDDGNGVVLLIPMSSNNTDYAAYLEWVAEGNTPEPWPPAE